MSNTTLPLKLNWDTASTVWATQINPVLGCEIVNGSMLSDIPLTVGANVINHLLGRKLIGWFIVGINGVSTVYDTQATNQMPQLTLNLTSSAAVTVSLWVF